MQAFSIVINFYIGKNSCFLFISGRKDCSSTALFLHCCPEALHRCVVIEITFSTRTCLNRMVLQQDLIASTRIFAAPIRMMDQRPMLGVDSARPSVTPFLPMLCHVAYPSPIRQFFVNTY